MKRASELISKSLIILNISVLFYCAAIAADVHEPVGIDRIEKASRYAYFVDQQVPPHILGYGHKVIIKNEFSYSGTQRFWALDDRGHQAWAPDSSIITGSLTGDIRTAILDRDRFDVALSQNRFADAWNMGKDTEQGLLWKELAFSQTKKHLKQLVREAVFEENLDKTIQARAIAGSFSEPTARELSDFIDAENASARTILENLVPDTAARLAALRSIADRLFE